MAGLYNQCQFKSGNEPERK
uniref:Uncharacterized protein n=1 Tax=Anguilla anguilla TaxID=7936 RepID=A0A0E9TE91_ANGAN